MKRINWTLVPIYSLVVIFSTLSACRIHKVENSISFADNKVVAHRGAWKQQNLPENSIASLKNAIRLKCTASEFDVRMTADNILVISHDPDYHGMPIEHSKYEDLTRYLLANGERLPTLKAYLLAGMEDNGSTGMLCEIKPAESKERGLLIAEKVVRLVHELKAEAYLLGYISFDYYILKKIKELNPQARTQYLKGSKSPDELKNDNISGLDYHMNDFKDHPEWIERARKLDLALNVWTVNTWDDLDFFLRKNFAYITTNEPELLLKLEHAQENWELLWHDEFDGDQVNLDNWNFVLWDAGRVNNEWQKYVEDTANYKVEGGKLTLTATKTGENKKGGYTSTRLNSKEKKEFKYGRIEFRAKMPMPNGKGSWPALWMLGSNHDEVRWPKCGEIDVMEYVGHRPDHTTNNIHTKYQYGSTDFHGDVPVKTAEEEFHNYGIVWDKEAINFYLDFPDNITNSYAPEIKTENNWPFDQACYLIMNFAVGGILGGRKGVDGSTFPQSMTVDYVRVYRLKE